EILRRQAYHTSQRHIAKKSVHNILFNQIQLRLSHQSHMRPQDLLQIREYALGRSLNHQLGPIYGQSSEIGMTRREEVGLISVYESVNAWSPTLVNTEESTPPSNLATHDNIEQQTTTVVPASNAAVLGVS
ncbi:hypothetical protein AAF712_016627, partial [Marasmius tenuissimus]